MAGNPNTLISLTKAILEKRCVAIRFDGKTRLVTIEPHAVYTDSNSNIILDFYQRSATGHGSQDGFWNTVAWRKINAVFWLNNSFSPRLKQGFTPALKKYQSGLLAIVDSGSRSRKSAMRWENIEASIDRLFLDS
ncbi:MAG: hypothetical protein ACC651_08380 [Candidatus Scalindua sp.]